MAFHHRRLSRCSACIMVVHAACLRLALNLGVTNAASSQLIDRLVVSGLIERTEDPTDRRAKQLTITTKGRTVLEQGIATRRKWMEDAYHSS